jgi:hypothetical protein
MSGSSSVLRVLRFAAGRATGPAVVAAAAAAVVACRSLSQLPPLLLLPLPLLLSLLSLSPLLLPLLQFPLLTAKRQRA